MDNETATASVWRLWGHIQTPTDDDNTEKIVYSAGIVLSHKQQHLLKMFPLWQRGLDTMDWLDWRAKVYDRALEDKKSVTQGKKLLLKQQLSTFAGYGVSHIDAQIAIYTYLPLLVQHVKQLLFDLWKKFDKKVKESSNFKLVADMIP